MSESAERVGRVHPFLTVILPAYNEGNRIRLTLTAIRNFFATRAYSVEVLVIDDGSVDNTSHAVIKLAGSMPGLKVLRNERNRGKGYSVRRGIMEARGSIVGFMDADYKTPVEEIEKLLPWLGSGYEVAIGSRALRESKVEIRQPIYRRLGSKAFAVVMHMMVGLPEIADTQCGFKFFSQEAAREIFSRQRVDGYMVDVEILRLAELLGYDIKQVPIRWMNDPDSRYKLFSGSLRNMKELLQIRTSRYAGAPTSTRTKAGRESRVSG